MLPSHTVNDGRQCLMHRRSQKTDSNAELETVTYTAKAHNTRQFHCSKLLQYAGAFSQTLSVLTAIFQVNLD